MVSRMQIVSVREGCQSRCITICQKVLTSLSNHDDDGNKNVTNLHIEQRKTIVLHVLHVHFPFLYILQPFPFFPQHEMPCFAVTWTTWPLITNIQFCLLISKALVPFLFFQEEHSFKSTNFE